MRKASFTLEVFGSQIFEGYTQDEDWNGWACPYFTFEEAQKIAETYSKTGEKADYDKISDSFYFEFQDEKESYSALDFDNLKLYPIGSSSWIWEELP